MNVETDQAFLSLLSSQRELLNRLNMEAASTNKIAHDPKREKTPSSRQNRPINCHSNRSIAERRSSLDIVTSKRFSIGFGCDHVAFAQADHSKAGLLPKSWKDDTLDYSSHKRSKVDFFPSDEIKARKKRRMSSLGFLSLDMFEEDVADAAWLVSDENEPSSNGIFDGEDNEIVEEVTTPVASYPVIAKPQNEGSKDNDDDSDDEDDDEESVVEEQTKVSLAAMEFKPIKIDPVKMKDTMMAFHKSMEMSQSSQKAIHDWDRKMGLKRSHSKTMRLSSRSRQKLKAIMKKEISLMKIPC